MSIDVRKCVQYNEAALYSNPEAMRALEELAAPPPEELAIVPNCVNYELFDEEQLIHLAEAFADQTKETVNKLLEFLTRGHAKYRICLLDKLINHPELKWAETPGFYGISSHKFFDVKQQVVDELRGNNCYISQIMQQKLNAKYKRAAGQKLAKTVQLSLFAED